MKTATRDDIVFSAILFAGVVTASIITALFAGVVAASIITPTSCNGPEAVTSGDPCRSTAHTQAGDLQPTNDPSEAFNLWVKRHDAEYETLLDTIAVMLDTQENIVADLQILPNLMPWEKPMDDTPSSYTIFWQDGYEHQIKLGETNAR